MISVIDDYTDPLFQSVLSGNNAKITFGKSDTVIDGVKVNFSVSTSKFFVPCPENTN
jgi:hypothetical protein